MAASASLQQVNVRLDAELKRQAEEVLAFMGSSATELIRCAYQKVARGAADYVEAMGVLNPREDDAGVVKADDPVRAGWSIAEDFRLAIGYDPAAAPPDDRSWEEIYDEAMTEHFVEKGLMA